MARQAAVDTADFAAAVERDSTRRHFVVITDAAEMEKLLAAPLAQWRVFLEGPAHHVHEEPGGGHCRQPPNALPARGMELKNWATGLLRGLSFDDLDAGIDDAEGVRSLIHGEPPLLKACPNEAAVAEAISAHLQRLIEVEHARPEAICVVAGTHRELETYEKKLKQVGLALHPMETGRAEDSGAMGVRLATVHRVKGLEFDHVILGGRLDVAPGVRGA